MGSALSGISWTDVLGSRMWPLCFWNRWFSEGEINWEEAAFIWAEVWVHGAGPGVRADGLLAPCSLLSGGLQGRSVQTLLNGIPEECFRANWCGKYRSAFFYIWMHVNIKRKIWSLISHFTCKRQDFWDYLSRRSKGVAVDKKHISGNLEVRDLKGADGEGADEPVWWGRYKILLKRE